MDALHRLAAADLTVLASALRSGRLTVPYSDIAVGRVLRGPSVGDATTLLGHSVGEGFSSRQIAALLEAVATRDRVRNGGDAVELVWSGPEVAGVSNRDTGVVLRELFASAQTDVLFAGFAVYQVKDIFRRLAEQMIEVPGLRVRMVLDIRRGRGDTTAASELVWKFLHRFRTVEWPGETLPELYYDPRSLDTDREKRPSMHAKCVVIDRGVSFVTSANFTEAALRRNIKVGAVIRSAPFSESLTK